MKVTKHLLEQFILLKEFPKERILIELNKIGLEVESFSEIKIPSGVVVGRILQKSKHPDADRLSVCQVDVGQNEVLQIVCGASNVDEGQWVAVALEGSRLQTSKGELAIQVTTLRGFKSQGMICSSIELGLPKTNEGIMVLDSSIGELECGKSLSTYEIFDNFIIELGLTPNRGDCLSVLGVARDLGVALGIPIALRTYKDENTVLGIGRVLQVACDANFSSSVLYKVANLEKIDTPLEMLLSLLLCGIEPQSSLHNFLNYAMHNIGVVLQAYPFEDFQGKNLESKAEIYLKNENGLNCVCGEGIKSIVGISLSAAKKMEGMIVLEASYIPPKLVSELIYNHLEIQKDEQIAYKTTRGSNPDLLLGMQFVCDLLIRFAQIEIYSSHHKIALDEQNIHIKTTFEAINAILGQRIDKEEITNLLKKIGFRIEASSDDAFFMAIPPIYRHDIRDIQDLSEEILRFYGIEKIHSKSLQFLQQSPRENPLYFRFKAKRKLMQKASAHGFCETLHYVFCQREKMQKLGVECIDENLDILNPITNELDTLRTSLIPSMLDSIERNKNFDFKAIALCEIGICYDKKRQEVEKIAFVVDGLRYAQSFLHPKGEKWDFYSFASNIAEVIGEFELEKIEDWNGISSTLAHPFQSAWIVMNEQRIGYISKINPQSGYDEGFFCEVLLDPLLLTSKIKKQEISRFQANIRDLTIMLDQDITFSQIKTRLQDLQIPYLQRFYPLDLYRHQSFDNQVALSLRFVLQSMEKTLQEEELNASMQSIIAILEEEFGASLRQ